MRIPELVSRSRFSASIIIPHCYRIVQSSIDRYFRVLKKQQELFVHSGSQFSRMPRMTSHAELLHHRPTNCHCNRVIQFLCVCPSNYRLQLSLYIYIYCYGAIIDEIPRRRYSDQIPVEGRGDGVSRDSSSLQFKLTTERETRRIFA